MAANDLFSLANIADQVTANYGDQSDITTAKAKKWVNRALLKVSTIGDWSWQRFYARTIPTVIAQESYSIADCKRITSIYLSSPIQRKLRLLEDRQFRRMYPNNTATGTPYYYRELGWSTSVVNSRLIGVYPIPQSVITMSYDGVRPIQMLVNDTDDIRLITGMPQHMVDAIVEIATQIGLVEVDDTKSGEALQEWMQWLSAAYREDQSNIEDINVMAPMDAYDSNRMWDPILPSTFGDF